MKLPIAGAILTLAPHYQLILIIPIHITAFLAIMAQVIDRLIRLILKIPIRVYIFRIQ
jgi:hypothetical protein